MASRVCLCGAPLLEVGKRTRCRSCGSSCALWLVASDTGLVIAVATTSEVALADRLRADLFNASVAAAAAPFYRLSLPGLRLST